MGEHSTQRSSEVGDGDVIDVRRSGRRRATGRHENGEQLDRSAVFGALGDEDCRRVLRGLVDEPKTASELADECALSSSKLYRKLELLLDAGLVEKTTKISTSGRNASEYAPCVDRVTIDITGADVSEPNL